MTVNDIKRRTLYRFSWSNHPSGSSYRSIFNKHPLKHVDTAIGATDSFIFYPQPFANQFQKVGNWTNGYIKKPDALRTPSLFLFLWLQIERVQTAQREDVKLINPVPAGLARETDAKYYLQLLE